MNNSSKSNSDIPDNTPIIVGAGQYTQRIASGQEPLLSAPMDLAATASRLALKDAGGSLQAEDINSIAVSRLFSDSAPAWACPFGASDNPPESIARRIGATPQQRIYGTIGGTQPLQLMAELFSSIARGEIDCALLAGAEAIANQRHAQRNSLTLDWSEQFDLPLDSRMDSDLGAAPAELLSGMYLPVHYYALIENHRAWLQHNSPQQHRAQMADLFSPLSQIASHNPYSYRPQAYSAERLLCMDKNNYPVSLPYSKLLVAQDAVNQSAALILCSAGKARECGINPAQWTFLQGYAEGSDHYLLQRQNPGTSESMRKVIEKTLESASVTAEEFDLIDIYSCFPCAVEAACDVLRLPIDGSKALSVTGGLPYFGGPGNNYSMHALAEMTARLRGTSQRALVTANGGVLSKHAAAALANYPADEIANPLNMNSIEPYIVSQKSIPSVAICDTPEAGTVISYTIIYERKKDDLAVVMAETAEGKRFLAHSTQREIVEEIKQASPAGRPVNITSKENRHRFSFTV